MIPPRIAIVGAGPAGCTLAHLLHKSGIRATVFEGEVGLDYRSQGGTLDLHTTTGLAAVKAAGLWDEFLRHARYDGDYTLFVDKDMKTFFKRAGPATPKSDSAPRLDEQRPEIDRAALRQLLVESLPQGTVQWGKRLKRVEIREEEGAAGGDGQEGPVTLVFADGTSAAGFDLVVGADGAWSRVRRALSDRQPEFARIGLYELQIPADAAVTAPELHAAVHRGSLFAYSDGKKISVQQMGDGSLIVAASAVQASPDWFLPQDRDGGKQDDANSETKKSRNLGSRIIDDPEEAARIRSSLVEEGGPFADWHPLLQDAIRRSAGRCVARSLYVLPVGFRWKHRRGITLVGDAAHLMTPYAGEGVNVAMEDALKLARAITDGKPADGDGGDALDAAVVAYEEEMWPRAEKVARLADELLKLWMFSGKVTRSVVAAAIALHAKFQTPRLLHPVASALSYALVYGQSILG